MPIGLFIQLNNLNVNSLQGTCPSQSTNHINWSPLLVRYETLTVGLHQRTLYLVSPNPIIIMHIIYKVSAYTFVCVNYTVQSVATCKRFDTIQTIEMCTHLAVSTGAPRSIISKYLILYNKKQVCHVCIRKYKHKLLSHSHIIIRYVSHPK